MKNNNVVESKLFDEAAAAATPRMTYVLALTCVLDYAAAHADAFPVDVVEKLTALRVQQEKRNSAEKKPTKVQEANESMRALALTALETLDKPVTVSELIQTDEALSALSNQKVAALVRQLVESGKVQRLEEKRKAYFKIIK